MNLAYQLLHHSQGPFEKFVDSHYYSNLELCGDAVAVFPPPKLLPLASDALLTMPYPLLENVLQTVDHLKMSCFRAPFSWLVKPRNHMGRDLDCMVDVLWGSRIQFRSCPMQFLGFSTYEKGALRQEISK
jgi:hypothetical protein